jgi:DeoR/GlpR family transcriptional regulator of sugar metabolism
MLTEDRKRLIRERLSRDGRVLAGPLAAELGVSEDSIRRDLRDLAAQGLLLRVHGGALPLSPTHRPLHERAVLARDEKARLGRAVAGLIRPGMVVILDGGTTAAAVVAALPPGLPLTLVTHSPAIAVAIAAGGLAARVVLIGGTLFPLSMVAVGAEAVTALARVRADLAVLGATGLHAEAGITTGDIEEAAVKRQIVASSAEVVLPMTRDKIGRASAFAVGPADLATTVATCGGRPDWLPPAVVHLAV